MNERMTLYGFEGLTHNRGQAHLAVVGDVYWIHVLIIGQVSAILQSLSTAAVASYLMNKSAKGFMGKVTNLLII